jgi:hypothetical protein
MPEWGKRTPEIRPESPKKRTKLRTQSRSEHKVSAKVLENTFGDTVHIVPKLGEKLPIKEASTHGYIVDSPSRVNNYSTAVETM